MRKKHRKKNEVKIYNIIITKQYNGGALIS